MLGLKVCSRKRANRGHHAVTTTVGMLRKTGRNNELELIMLHYMYGVSKSTISRWKKCSEGKIRQRLMIAETFIAACIIMSGAKLEIT